MVKKKGGASERKLPEKERGKPGVPKGQKAVAWETDHAILLRLETVSAMMLQGAKMFQIAEALGYSLDTAYEDRKRVKRLWAQGSERSIRANRNRSIAQYREQQAEAWAEYRKYKSPSWLRLVMDIEDRITKLQGTEQHKLDLTSKGKQVGVTVDDMADIFQKMGEWEKAQRHGSGSESDNE